MTLTEEITSEEITSEISKLKTNKALGMDGYTSEFYKPLWGTINPNPNTKNTFKIEIPSSWREAFIFVIPKEGKDKLDCSNYRLVSILNQEYSLFTAIMARHLETILPDIIHVDQTGFLKRRPTQDNIRCTLHVMQQIIKKKKNTRSSNVGIGCREGF